MKLLDLISEQEKTMNRKFDYGCVMLYFNFPDMYNIHNKINSDDLYTEEEDDSYGLEDEPHVTLLYGLHDEVETEDVVNILEQYEFDELNIHNPSIFKNDEYDVLKYDVIGENLHEINEQLRKFPHTNQYNEYHPHMTVAYLKKGKGKKYADMLKKYEDFWVTPIYAVYSRTNGDKVKIKINNE